MRRVCRGSARPLLTLSSLSVSPVYWTGRVSAGGSGTKWKVKIFHQASREPLPGVGPGCPATHPDISLLLPSAWLSLGS